jgi:hypothetical protein
MRERINDVAAEVARLTAALEGPSSPIEAILAGESAGQGAAYAGPNGTANENGSGQQLSGEKFLGTIAANGAGQKGSLADRIRALQDRRTRVAQTG